jgi:penicillin-binding protein 1C
MIAQALSGGHPRIIAPARGTVIALDPDIPPSRQRVIFEARSGRAAPLRWLLDGTDLGSATDLVVWNPYPGRHTLSLVDDDQRPLDTISFEVRGLAVRSLN